MSRSVIGILGGSFNPVHSGHMMLASYMAQFAPIDAVKLVLSPCNPLKQGTEMASDHDRFNMLRLACGGSPLVEASDVELSMPRPSYSIDTLRRLESDYPGYHFKLIVGSDNWAIFDRWRSAREIIDRFGVLVYPRRGYSVGRISVQGVEVVDAPMIDISSTFIRNNIAAGRDMNFFLPEAVYDYIKDKGLYK